MTETTLRAKKRLQRIRKILFLLILLLFAAVLGLVLRTVSGPAVSAVTEVKNVESSRNEKEAVILAIDAGHGGMDGGAVSAEGIEEKDINLAIANCLAEAAKDYPVQIRMTRRTDCGLYRDDNRSIRQKKREDLLARRAILDEEDVTLGISVHLNSFPQDEKVYGAQVFYPKTQTKETNVLSCKTTAKGYAEAVQKSLEKSIPDGKERCAMAKDDILIFEDAKQPRILVECGFLSNPVECKKLQSAEYQRLLGRAIWDGINEILCLEKGTKIEVIDSANKGC